MDLRNGLQRAGLLLLITTACAKQGHECQPNQAYREPFKESKIDLDGVQALSNGKNAGVLYDVQCLNDSQTTAKLPQVVLKSHMKIYSVEESSISILEKKNNPCVIGVSEAKALTLRGSDPQAAQQDHLRSLKVNELDVLLAKSNNPGREVVVAVIDSGTDLTHEDLIDNKWINADEIPGNNIDDDKNGYIDDVNGYNFASRIGASGPDGTWEGVDHGTHVGGLIAATEGNDKGVRGIRGVNIKIMSLNVFGRVGGASNVNIENAIRYAADNGADIINMSLGGPGRTATTESALIYAINKGTAVVVAAGNDGMELTDTNWDTPASYSQKLEGMITVGSSNSKSGTATDYTNYSSKYVEVLSPGSEDSNSRRGLLSTFIGNRYGRMEGTSMASPVAAGVLAVLKAYLPATRAISTNIEAEFMKLRRIEDDKKSVVSGGGVLDVSLVAKAIEEFVIPPAQTGSTTGGVTGATTGATTAGTTGATTGGTTGGTTAGTTGATTAGTTGGTTAGTTGGVTGDAGHQPESGAGNKPTAPLCT